MYLSTSFFNLSNNNDNAVNKIESYDNFINKINNVKDAINSSIDTFDSVLFCKNTKLSKNNKFFIKFKKSNNDYNNYISGKSSRRINFLNKSNEKKKILKKHISAYNYFSNNILNSLHDNNKNNFHNSLRILSHLIEKKFNKGESSKKSFYNIINNELIKKEYNLNLNYIHKYNSKKLYIKKQEIKSNNKRFILDLNNINFKTNHNIKLDSVKSLRYTKNNDINNNLDNFYLKSKSISKNVYNLNNNFSDITTYDYNSNINGGFNNTKKTTNILNKNIKEVNSINLSKHYNFKNKILDYSNINKQNSKIFKNHRFKRNSKLNDYLNNNLLHNNTNKIECCKFEKNLKNDKKFESKSYNIITCKLKSSNELDNKANSNRISHIRISYKSPKNKLIYNNKSNSNITLKSISSKNSLFGNYNLIKKLTNNKISKFNTDKNNKDSTKVADKQFIADDTLNNLHNNSIDNKLKYKNNNLKSDYLKYLKNTENKKALKLVVNSNTNTNKSNNTISNNKNSFCNILKNYKVNKYNIYNKNINCKYNFFSFQNFKLENKNINTCRNLKPSTKHTSNVIFNKTYNIDKKVDNIFNTSKFLNKKITKLESISDILSKKHIKFVQTKDLDSINFCKIVKEIKNKSNKTKKLLSSSLYFKSFNKKKMLNQY